MRSSGLSRWVLNPITSIFLKDGSGEGTATEEKAVKMEAEFGHKLRNTASHEEPEEARKDLTLEPPRGAYPC